MRSWLLAISLLGALAAGCDTITGSGNLKTETREVGAFSGVEVTSIIKAKVKLGEKAAVSLSGDDNLLSLIETKVRDGRLVAQLKGNSGISTKLSITLEVTTPRLESLSAQGASRIEATGSTGGTFAIRAAGASHISVQKVASDDVTIHVEGASRVTVAGKAKDLSLDVAGASNVQANELLVDAVDAKIAGASHAGVQASQEVKGDVSGAGSLKVQGNPAKRSVTTSGAGRVSY